jgi:hypothetical protein
VIGLSNVFETNGDLASAWLDAAKAAQRGWGPIAVIGYDSGASLEAAHHAGFDSIGELVVWVKTAIA